MTEFEYSSRRFSGSHKIILRDVKFYIVLFTLYVYVKLVTFIRICREGSEFIIPRIRIRHEGSPIPITFVPL